MCRLHVVLMYVLVVLYQMMIIRIGRQYLEQLSNALCYLTVIDQQHCRLRTLHCGGTIRSCQRYMVEHDRRAIQALVKN